MRGSFWKRLCVLVPVALLGVLPVVAQAQETQKSQTGDAVADAARKAREQKKNEPKAKKVYTDDDISPRKEAPASAAQPAGAQATAGTGQTGTTAQTPATSNDNENSEAAWRKRFAAQRAKIAKAQEELDILQRELEKSQVQYYSDPQKAMNQQLTRKDVNDKTAKIAEKKQELAKLQSEMDDMEDQLRKAGGDPGWARP
jgi:chromosome segregation ATPase